MKIGRNRERAPEQLPMAPTDAKAAQPAQPAPLPFMAPSAAERAADAARQRAAAPLDAAAPTGPSSAEIAEAVKEGAGMTLEQLEADAKVRAAAEREEPATATPVPEAPTVEPERKPD